MIKIRRVYDAPSPEDGARFLVDALWPRGLKKDDLEATEWLKSVAPSKELRQWFGHEPVKWEEFQRKYSAELNGRSEAWQPLLNAARNGDVTLLFSARDTEHNNAIALKSFLEAKFETKRAKTRRPQAFPKRKRRTTLPHPGAARSRS